MPEHLQQLYSRNSDPEGAVTAVAYLKLDRVPEHLMGSKGRKAWVELGHALEAEARKAERYLSADLLKLETDVKLRKGSLEVEITIFFVELRLLVSQACLENIGFWALVAEGIRDGSRSYIAHTTFRAIKILESEVKRTLFQLIGAAKHHLGLTIRDRLKNPFYSEARTGILGVLVKLYKNSQVARGNSDIRMRIKAMKDVASNLRSIRKTARKTAITAKDRSSLCDLLKVILSEISEESLTGARNQREHSKRREFNSHLDRSQLILNSLCPTR